jgi:hypothetical protein
LGYKWNSRQIAAQSFTTAHMAFAQTGICVSQRLVDDALIIAHLQSSKASVATGALLFICGDVCRALKMRPFVRYVKCFCGIRKINLDSAAMIEIETSYCIKYVYYQALVVLCDYE